MPLKQRSFFFVQNYKSMQSIIKFTVIIVGGFIFSNCQNTNVDAFTFLEGRRVTTYQQNKVIETWEKTGDTLIGKRYYAGFIAGDSALQDIFKIYANQGLTLEWSNPKGINPYYLRLSKTTDSAFIFTNAEYAYPSEVEIRKAGNDSVYFRSYGKQGVVPKGVTFVLGSE